MFYLVVNRINKNPQKETKIIPYRQFYHFLKEAIISFYYIFNRVSDLTV